MSGWSAVREEKMKCMKSEMFHATDSLSFLFLHCYFIIHCKSLVLPDHKHAEKSTVHIQGDVLNLRPKVRIFNFFILEPNGENIPVSQLRQRGETGWIVI